VPRRSATRARILWQELRQDDGYRGSYETVKRFVRPLRTEALRAELTWTRRKSTMSLILILRRFRPQFDELTM